KNLTASKKGWRRFTLHSVDLARPGITPWLAFDPGNNNNYQYNPGPGQPPVPVGTQVSLPQPLGTTVNAATPGSPSKGEFGFDFRGVAGKTSTPGWTFATAARFSLQTPVWDSTILPNGAWRSLTDYPVADVASGRILPADALQLQKANADRQQ